MVLTTTYINDSITLIETLEGSFVNEFCNILKRHTGNDPIYEKLDNINIAITAIIDILKSYTAYGDSILNDTYNYLYENDIVSLIDYCNRVMNKFQFNIYIPNDPNIYL